MGNLDYLDTNGDFVLIKGATSASTCLCLCLHGDNSNIHCAGNVWNLGRSIGQSLTMNKSSNVMVYSIPFNDSDNTLGFDIGGVKREFVFNGIVVAPDVECITRFIQVINGLVNGKQMVSSSGDLVNVISLDYKFNRDWRGTSFYDYNTGSTFVSQVPVNPINIMITNFSYTYNAAQECQLAYTLQYVECNPVADGSSSFGSQYNPWGT